MKPIHTGKVEKIAAEAIVLVASPRGFSAVSIALATALLLATANLHARCQAPPSPQATSLPVSYRVAGTVMNAATGEPLQRAAVAVLAEGDGHVVQSAESDGEGHFALEGLPAAKYQLTASKRGFRTAFYDEHDEFNSAVVTGANQQTDHLIFRLTPASVLRGVVTADGGEAVAGAEVMLFLKPRSSASGERMVQVGTTATDDSGAYEFGNLAAGQYLLAVKAEPWYAMHRSVQESAQRPPDDPSAALDAAYPITYFDSTTEEDSASPIVLAGGSRAEANISLQAVPALHLTLDAPRSEQGASAAAMPTLRQFIFGTAQAIEPQLPSAASSQKTIDFSGIAPGHYELEQGDPPHILEVEAAISQQVDASLGTPTVAVSGSLRLSSGAAPTGAAFVLLEPRDKEHGWNRLEAACIKGAFGFPEVPPGNWRLRVDSSGTPLPVVAISVGLRTHAGNLLTVRGSPLSLQVAVNQGTARIEGYALSNGKGQAGAMIVLVPRDLTAMRSLVRRDQSDSDGSFSLRDVVAGQYTVVAIDDGWTLDWTNPEVIRRYLSGGLAVTVTNSSDSLLQLSAPVPLQPR